MTLQMRAISVGLLLLSTAALADIAPEPFAAAGEGRPMPGADAASLVMAKEEVIITLHDDFAIVDAVFEMSNEAAEPKTINVGFPGKGVLVRGGRGHLAHRPLIGFTAWVDGKHVASTSKTEEIVTKGGPPGREYSKRREEIWHAFSATFAPNKVTTIKVRYAVISDGYRGDSWSSDELFTDGTVSYVLATGARWSRAIGEAVVRVRVAKGLSLDSVRVRDGKMEPLQKRSKGEKVERRLPAYAKAEKTEVVIRRSALEPTSEDNLEIVYGLKTPKPMGRVDPQSEAKAQKAAESALR